MSKIPLYHLIHVSKFNNRQIVEGITAYARQHTDWYFPQTMPYAWKDRQYHLDTMTQLKCGGCIAYIEDESLLNRLCKLKLPIVDVANVVKQNLFPVCSHDFDLMGRSIVQYFYQRGYYNLMLRTPRLSENHFANELKDSFINECQRLNLNPTHIDQDETEQLAAVLDAKPRAFAAFVFSQKRLIQTLNEARKRHYQIPNDMAILGYGLDGPLEYGNHGISMIQPAHFSIGWHAAKILHDLLDGKTKPWKGILFPHEGIHEDESTHSFGVRSAELCTALDYIHKNFKKSINISDIAENSNLSRRSLERRFRKELQSSPLKILEARRIEEVRRLLMQSDITISLIALHCGFSNPTRMSQAFKRHTGLTPRSYRTQFRS